MRNQLININPQNIFLIIGLIFGIAFLLITPPLQVSDEGEHFDKALFLSEGNVMPEILNHYAGYYVPKSEYEFKYNFYSFKDKHLNNSDKKLKIENIFSLLYQPPNYNNRTFTDTISTVAIITYSPLPYLTSAFAIAIGKTLNFSPLILMYLGRLANLLIWLVFIYMAIRITPIHKWVLLMLSLMPMAIFQGASLSADSFTIALSFLVISIFLKFSFDSKEINYKDIGILFILMLMLSLTKQAYFLLSFLFFLIPPIKWGNRKKMLLIFSLLFISTFEISIIWNMNVNKFYLPNVPYISIPGQTSFILSNPLNLVNAIINTLLTKDMLCNILISFVGNLGWNSIPLPNWLITIYLSILTLTALLDKNNVIINIKQKIIIFITLSTTFTLICASMYITGTPVGQNTINSIQGRYIIPIAPLLFLLFYNNKIQFEIKKEFKLIIICSVIISLTTTLYMLINNFYTIPSFI